MQEFQSVTPSAATSEATLADPGLNMLTPEVDALTPAEREQVDAIAAGIDIHNSQQMIQYGIGAQSKISEFANHILGQVRAKDAGYVGNLMTDLLVQVKSLDIDALDGKEKRPTWFRRAKKSMSKFAAQYETVDAQLDRIANELAHVFAQRHRHVRSDVPKEPGIFSRIATVYPGG